MTFKKGRRFGSLWEDTKSVIEEISSWNTDITATSESDFEQSLSPLLKRMENKGEIESPVITQKHRDRNVINYRFFGKGHRPDMALGEEGTAIELKFLDGNLNGAKEVIGQSHIYRLQYKFCILVLVVSENNKDLYTTLDNGGEPQVNALFQHLAENNNVFTLIKPAFATDNGASKAITFLDP